LTNSIRRSATVTAFVEDECELDGMYSVDKAILYDSFVEWREQQGIERRWSRETFARDLLDTYRGTVRASKRQGDKRKGEVDRPPIYAGIRLRQKKGASGLHGACPNAHSSPEKPLF
jgi:phage/plasmid-associated DNA primase